MACTSDVCVNAGTARVTSNARSILYDAMLQAVIELVSVTLTLQAGYHLGLCLVHALATMILNQSTLGKHTSSLMLAH